MPRGRRGGARGGGDSSDDDDDSSSGDERGPRAPIPERYAAADIRSGLLSRPLRIRALQELAAVVRGGYARADKRVQAAVFEDLLTAARLRDGREAARAAQSAALDAARRALPQQRRSALAGERKRAALTAHREGRRQRRPDGGGGGGGGGGDEGSGSSSDESEAEFYDVPSEVARVIIGALDPVSLGRAACVCRAWRGMVEGEGELWAAQARRVFGARGAARLRAEAEAAAAAAGGPAAAGAAAASPAAAFRRLAAERPARLMPWRARRAFVDGRLVWTAALGGAQAAAGREPDGGQQQRRRPGRRRDRAGPAISYPSPEQVVDWLCGGDVGGGGGGGGGFDSSSSGSDGSDCGSGGDSSGSEGSDGGAATRLRLWAWPKG